MKKRACQTAWNSVEAALEPIAQTAGGTAEPQPLGKNWFPRFCEHHKGMLAFHAKERTRGLTEERAMQFYSLLESVVKKYSMEPSQIFSMDETGVQHGTASKSFKYLVARRPRTLTVTAKQDGSQELTTIIETIAADGTLLPPVYIFKGKLIDLSLLWEESHGGHMTSSESGWTNGDIAHAWFKESFLPQSEKIAGKGKTRLFIMDGHTSHFSFDLIELARQNAVAILSLPAHCTHAMAPLDRTFFAPVKTAWAEAQRLQMMLTGKIRKDDVIRIYQIAREKGFKKENIIKGFAATGIWPLTGVAALPAAIIQSGSQLTEDQVEEERQEAWDSCELAEQLMDIVNKQRSVQAKAVLIQAARSAAEAQALNKLFENQFQKLQDHAAAMKSKPRSFRVAHPQGQAKLLTSDEAWKAMQDAADKKLEAELQKVADAAQKEKEKPEKQAAEEARRIAKAKEKKERAEQKQRQKRAKAEAKEARKRAAEEKRVAAEAEKAQKAKDRAQAKERKERAVAEAKAARQVAQAAASKQRVQMGEEAESAKRKQSQNGSTAPTKKRKIVGILQNTSAQGCADEPQNCPPL